MASSTSAHLWVSSYTNWSVHTTPMFADSYSQPTPMYPMPRQYKERCLYNTWNQHLLRPYPIKHCSCTHLTNINSYTCTCASTAIQFHIRHTCMRLTTPAGTPETNRCGSNEDLPGRKRKGNINSMCNDPSYKTYSKTSSHHKDLESNAKNKT